MIGASSLVLQFIFSWLLPPLDDETNATTIDEEEEDDDELSRKISVAVGIVNGDCLYLIYVVIWIFRAWMSE
jgi:hypothetical protein